MAEWHQELLNDLSSAEQMLAEPNCQFARRVYLRCLVTLIEADIHDLRQEIARRVIDRSDFSGKWNIHLLTLLMDDRPSISQQGEIRLTRQQHTLSELAKFILTLYRRLAGSDEDYFAQHGWDTFRKLIAIRNRVAHPKKDEDIILSDDDMIVINRAKAWYLDTLADIARIDAESCGRAIRVEDIVIPFFDDSSYDNELPST